MPRPDEILFKIAEILLVPCIATLVLLSAATLFALGRFAREALERRRLPKAPEARFRELRALLDHKGAGALDVERYLAAAEDRYRVRVERLALAAKLGPMCGLMGTLIPLGPALLALGSGSMGELGRGIAVAFATTVVGLAVSGPCFSMATVKRRWYERDLAEMDVYARLVLEGGAPVGAGA